MPLSLTLSYDAEVDVAYLTLRQLARGELLGPTLLLEHDRDFPGAVALDFGAVDGRAVGLEFQMASACLPAELLVGAARTDGQSLAARFDERVGRRFAAELRAPGGRRKPVGRDVAH